MINAIIIDDEKHSSEALAILIGECCPQVNLVSICNSGHEGLIKIHELDPQLVFLDIEMPNMNGFQMLEQLRNPDFDLIFTTSYDQYAIKAIKFSALDYLLKPVDRMELETALQKYILKSRNTIPQQLEILLEKVNKSKSIQRIALPTMQGLELVPVNSIISCAANNNYTEFFLSDKKHLLVSRTLKETEELLEGYGFLRVHHSYIVNINEIVRYIKGEGGYLIMTNGSTIDVSRSKKELLLNKLLPQRQ